MISKKFEELKFGILILGVGLFYFIMTMQIETKDTSINSRTLPLMLCMILGCLGIVQTLKGIKGSKKEGITKVIKKMDIKTVIKTGMTIVIYILVFEPLGFLLTTGVFLFTMFYILSPEYKKPNLTLYGVISLCTSLGVYLIFRYGLDIMLPQGIIGVI